LHSTRRLLIYTIGEFDEYNTARPEDPAFEGHEQVQSNHEGESIYRFPRALSSSLGLSRIERFEDIEGHPAGEDIQQYTDSLPTGPPSLDPNNLWAPFESRYEYGLTRWFLDESCTKGTIASFLRDPMIEPIRTTISAKAADDIFDRLHNIPYGIPGGDR
jgi:hypothetical protein